MKTLIIENHFPFPCGWGNGYVIIPKGHPLHGVDYNDIDVDVHGGLTCSEYLDTKTLERFGLDEEHKGGWIVGFDTCHYGDSLIIWTKRSVQEETDWLREQLMNY